MYARASNGDKEPRSASLCLVPEVRLKKRIPPWLSSLHTNRGGMRSWGRGVGWQVRRNCVERLPSVVLTTRQAGQGAKKQPRPPSRAAQRCACSLRSDTGTGRLEKKKKKEKEKLSQGLFAPSTTLALFTGGTRSPRFSVDTQTVLHGRYLGSVVYAVMYLHHTGSPYGLREAHLTPRARVINLKRAACDMTDERHR